MAEIPIILGRSFLATARVLKDYEKGTIEFRVSGETFCVDTVKSKKSDEPYKLDMDELFKAYWNVSKLDTKDQSTAKSDIGKPSVVPSLSKRLDSVDSFKNTFHLPLKIRYQSAWADQKLKHRSKKKRFLEQ